MQLADPKVYFSRHINTHQVPTETSRPLSTRVTSKLNCVREGAENRYPKETINNLEVINNFF